MVGGLGQLLRRLGDPLRPAGLMEQAGGETGAVARSGQGQQWHAHPERPADLDGASGRAEVQGDVDVAVELVGAAEVVAVVDDVAALPQAEVGEAVQDPRHRRVVLVAQVADQQPGAGQAVQHPGPGLGLGGADVAQVALQPEGQVTEL